MAKSMAKMTAKDTKADRILEYVIKEIMSTTDDRKREVFILDNRKTIEPLVKLLTQTVTSGGDQSTAKLALNCILLITCAATEKQYEPTLCSAVINETQFIVHMISDIVCGQPDDQYYGILVNLTRYGQTVQQVYKLCPKDFIRKLVSQLDANALVSALIANLSQLEEVRRTLADGQHIQHLFEAYGRSSGGSQVRNAIVCIVRNCCCDETLHRELLAPRNDLLVKLCLPIAGPEELDDEDNGKLPIDLQYLSADKRREEDSEIRKLLMESLLMLCSTRFGREVIRDHNIYPILREYHKWEKVRETQKACEDVVEIIIKTEDEIGVEDLKALDIPDDLIKQFNEMDKELVKEDDDKEKADDKP